MGIAARAGGLLHRLFTLTRSRMRYVSVARSRSSRLSRCYLASRSMVYGLSSLPKKQRAHPTDLSKFIISKRRVKVNRSPCPRGKTTNGKLALR